MTTMTMTRAGRPTTTRTTSPSSNRAARAPRGESTNYLDMSTSTLAGLLKNAKLAVKTSAKKIADSEPWTAVVEQHHQVCAAV